MVKTYLSYNNIVSNLGFDSQTVVDHIVDGISGVHPIHDEKLLPEPFCASLLPAEEIEAIFADRADSKKFTRLEQMMILSLQPVIEASGLELDDDVGLIISTTKGNIDVLENGNPFPKNRAYLDVLASVIGDYFGFKNTPIVLSNACVSGVAAVSVAKQFIQQSTFKHVFIASGDLITKFILSGFGSFQALSKTPCKPYDKHRDGINLGEAAASVLVTTSTENLPKEAVAVLGTATCNDANHISGPSRTGEGLYRSVSRALQEASVKAEEIDYISAHGTATHYNDEMEAVAFNRLGLQHTPLNSLKGYFGHTLGASGLLETIIGMHSLDRDTLFTSKGFETRGISKPLHIIEHHIEKPLHIFLKTASGFGGCNTAAIFKKAITN